MKHVVALSGGKDSTAMALRLAELEPRDYMYVCTPTGDELPEMIDHWKQLGEMLGTAILPVTSGTSLQGLIRKENCLPNNRIRYCTRKLKLEPYYRWLAEQGECVSYVGLRADEGTRSGMNFPDANKIQMRFPMRDDWGWGIADVMSYLEQRGVTIPARTDCARCYHQTLGEWYRLWKLHPEIYADAEEQEREISERHEQQRTFRNASRDTWPAGLAELRREFEAGRIPLNTVTQIDMFSGEQRRPGMCRPCSL